MSTPVKFPEMPDLPEDTPKPLRDWCETVEQQLAIMRGTVAGGTASRFVTIRDLIDAGVINEGDIV